MGVVEVLVGIVATTVVVLGILFAVLFQGSPSLLRTSVDLLGLLFKVKKKTKAVKGQAWGVVNEFERALAQNPDKLMIVRAESAEGEGITYREMDLRSNKVCRWLIQTYGLQRGSTVALLMPNCIDYVVLWLAVAKAGCTTALLNTNLSGTPLVHVIHTALRDSPVKVLVVDEGIAEKVFTGDVLDRVENIPDATVKSQVHVVNLPEDGATTGSLTQRIQNSSDDAIDASMRAEVSWKKPLFYVYTSGTTGLPKASKINHLRFWSGGSIPRYLCNLTPDDRLYSALPLYHASGGIMGMSGVLQAGCTLVLRQKFSVSQFSRDIVTHQCTAMQYIGELCRYLCAAKPNPLDGTFPIRYALGNGLRPDVWERFTRRYNVQNVVEFYAATEGNTNLFNNTGKVGSIGLVPWWAQSLYPVRLIQCDEVTNEPIRDPVTGLCKECKPGQVGQIVGLIVDSDPMRRFDGYTDKAATKKKITTDVARKGDRYFLSGDLMKRDAFGFFYWHDRIGDTFRWKGENVSTAEVAGVLCNVVPDAFEDVNCYGVEVPHCDGRAGMAAVTFAETVNVKAFDWGAFYAKVGSELPAYAQPVFIKVAQKLEYTTTFKHKKVDMRKNGFSLEQLHEGECILFRDAVNKTYSRLTEDVEAKINAGGVKL